MATSIKVPVPVALLDNDIHARSSIDKWRVSVEHYLSQDKEFEVFLDQEKTWTKLSVSQSSGQEDGEKRLCLDRMLALVAAYSPSMLYIEITEESNSMKSIWNMVRTFYQCLITEPAFVFLHYDSIRKPMSVHKCFLLDLFN